MLKYTWVLLLLLSGVSPDTWAQGRLSDLTTDVAVQRVVRSLDKDYENFRVKSRLRFTDKRVQRKYKQEKIKAWEKADIDGNGLTDLLITGTHYDEESKVICVLNMGDSLVLEGFSRQFYRYCPVARITYQDNQPLISYADYDKPFLIIDSLEERQDFLLTYRFEGLIEYNSTPTSGIQPDSIKYSSHFAYHDVEEVEIRVDFNGSTKYHSCEYPVLDESKKQYEDLTAKLSSNTHKQLVELLNYMQPDKLSCKYQVSTNHVPYISLDVAYADGRRLKVRDRGGIGSFGLERLYVLLDSLRKTQMWESARK